MGAGGRCGVTFFFQRVRRSPTQQRAKRRASCFGERLRVRFSASLTQHSLSPACPPFPSPSHPPYHGAHTTHGPIPRDAVELSRAVHLRTHRDSALVIHSSPPIPTSLHSRHGNGRGRARWWRRKRRVLRLPGTGRQAYTVRLCHGAPRRVQAATASARNFNLHRMRAVVLR